jgi:hypothetical protein
MFHTHTEQQAKLQKKNNCHHKNYKFNLITSI